MIAGCVVGSLAACFIDPGVSSSSGGPTGATSSGGSTADPSATGTTAATSTAGVTVTAGTATTDPTTTGSGSTSSELGTSSGVGGTSSGGATAEASSGGGSSGGVELPVPDCGTVLYYNDFKDGAGELVLTGDWTWDQGAGELVTTTGPGQTSNAYIPGAEWTDIRAYVSARIDQGGGSASLRMRSEVPKTLSYYHGGIRPGRR